MGREIRRVPAGWEHPRVSCPHSPWRGGCDEALSRSDRTCFQPLYDRSYAIAVAEWKEGFRKWESGEDRAEPDMEFWEYDGAPPERDHYRPEWLDETATHYQVYETVSEGTPVTPAFGTKAELVDYLVTHGDFWDQHRYKSGSQPRAGWDREAAEKFVESEWACSMVIDNGVVKMPRDGQF